MLIDQRYETVSLVKRGSASTVYLAKDRHEDTHVVLKLLNQSSNESRHRLHREFRVMSRLNHPNIVKVLGMGIHEAQPYLVMEHLSGGTLQAWFQEPLASARQLSARLSLLVEVTDALAYIHAAGIIHRNLKPDNVMLEGGRLKVMDFGLVKSETDATLLLTQEGAFVGTAAYMSPEQARGGTLDARSDLYAFGCLLFWALVGEPPFTGGSSADILVKHRNHPPQHPSNLNPLVPKALDQVVLKLLQKVPDERYSTAAAVGTELRQLAQALGEADGSTSNHEAVASTPPRDADAYSPTQLFNAPLVGKEALWQKLSAALHHRDQSGHFFTIRSEKGLGLSRLLEELRREARLLEQVALKLEMSMSSHAPYHAWREALLTLQRALPEAFSKSASGIEEALAPLLPELVEGKATLFPAEVMQLRLYDAVDVLFSRLSKTWLIVLLVDDLHLADEGSIGLLAYLARGSFGKHALIVAGVRRDRLSPSLSETLRDLTSETLELQPLSSDSVKHLIQALLGAEVDPQLENHVAERAAGNPFFIEEMLKALLESGQLTRRLGIWEWTREAGPIPHSIEEVFLQRLEQLPKRAQRALGVASTIGEAFDFDVLLDLLDMDEDMLLDAIEDLLRGGFITELPGDTYAFTHPLLHDLLHERLEPQQRRHLHLQLAQTLSQDANTGPAELAKHYAETEMPVLAVPYALEVARRARSIYANDVAERYYRLVLKVLPEGDTRIGEVKLELGSVLECIGRWQEAHDLYAQVLDQAELRARALHHLGVLSNWQGNLQESEDYLKQALALDPSHAETYGFLGRTLVMKGDADNAEQVLRQGLQVAKATPENREKAIVGAYLDLVNLEFNCSRWDKALAWLEHARALISPEDRLLNGRLLHWLAMVHHIKQNLAEARNLYEQARDAFLSVGDLGKLLIVLQNMALVHAETGDRQRALLIYNDIKLRARRLGDKNELARATANQGETLLKLGHHDEAKAALEEAKGVFQRLGVLQSEVYVRLSLISMLAQQGVLEDAKEEARTVKAILERSPHANHDALLRLRQGEIALYDGNPTQARDLLSESVSSFQKMDDKHMLLEAKLLLAKTNIVLADHDAAKLNLEQAKGLAQAYNDPVLNLQIAYLAALNEQKHEEVNDLKEELEVLSQEHFVTLVDKLMAVAKGNESH